MDLTLSIPGRDVISSGTLALGAHEQTLVIGLAGLTVEFEFSNETGEAAVTSETVSSTKFKIYLAGFLNPLGTSYDMPALVTVDGKAFRLLIVVHAIAADPSPSNPPVRVITYTLSTER